MTRRRNLLLALLALSLTPSVWAMDAKFQAQGRSQSIHVHSDYLAVVASPGNIRRVQANVNPTVAKRLLMLGAALIPKQKLRSQDRVLGLPFHFEGHKEAIGILTEEVVVRFQTQKALEKIQSDKRVLRFEQLPFGTGLLLVQFSSPVTALEGSNELSKRPGILYAHPNFILPKDFRKKKSPNEEPHYNYQWHLANDGRWGGSIGSDINVNPAWLISQGTTDVKVAVLDGGFEMEHPDLVGGWSVNSDEVADNGKDDDGNGYIDDVTGWNFYDDSNTPGTGLYSDHGTAVAGLVGARLNGTGMVGVCPKCSIIPVVVAWRATDDAAAFYYAKSRGADIITNSWGYAVGTPSTDVVVEAINSAAESSIVLFAMNNINQNDCIGNTPDISSLDSVVAVSASSDEDLKVSFSAWGECMEFVSPSFESKRPGIATTDLTGNRGYNNGRREGDMEDLDYTKTFSGTSAATPIAAGVFGLMLSANRDLKRDDAIGLMITTTDKVHPDKARYDPNSGFSQKYGYGRINAGNAVRAAQVFRKYTQKKGAPEKSL